MGGRSCCGGTVPFDRAARRRHVGDFEDGYMASGCSQHENSIGVHDV